MRVQLSPRARKYAKRVGIVGGALGFLPLGLRAVMMISDYFIDRSDSSSFGEVGIWAIPMLIMAVFFAAIGVAIGAVLGIGVALIFDMRPASDAPATAPVGFDGTLPPRVKSWAMWGAIVFAALAVIANTYQLIWPVPELVDRSIESLALVPRVISYAIQYAKSIVVDGLIGAILGGGAAAIANRFRPSSSTPAA
ncbi:MAG: hypothetical protein M3Z17_04285 [Gemmatimonadota bacterium]|nr:hypothetical protein [Gemmatimonadota bacterium]